MRDVAGNKEWWIRRRAPAQDLVLHIGSEAGRQVGGRGHRAKVLAGPHILTDLLTYLTGY